MPGARQEDVYGRTQGAKEQAEPAYHPGTGVLPGTVPGGGTCQADVTRWGNTGRTPVPPATAAQRAIAGRLQGLARRAGTEGAAQESAWRGDQLLSPAMALPEPLRRRWSPRDR